MYGLERVARERGIDRKLLHLIKTRVSQINGCAFCIDMHTKDARAAGETEGRIYALDVVAGDAVLLHERERSRAGADRGRHPSDVPRPPRARRRSTRARPRCSRRASLTALILGRRRHQRVQPRRDPVPRRRRLLPARHRRDRGASARVSMISSRMELT